MSTRSAYDPFGWRLEELATQGLNPLRRAELIDDLLVAEAEEIARGCRHLTIVHGVPTDLAEFEDLNEFYDQLSDIVECVAWSRLTGGHAHVTLTVAGCGRDEALARSTDLAVRRGPRWQVLDGPYVVPSLHDPDDRGTFG